MVGSIFGLICILDESFVFVGTNTLSVRLFLPISYLFWFESFRARIFMFAFFATSKLCSGVTDFFKFYLINVSVYSTYLLRYLRLSTFIFVTFG